MTISEIVHWVDGKPWEGTSSRFADVTNPGDRRGDRPRSRSRRRPTSTPAVRRARRGAGEWRAASLSRRERGAVRVPRAARARAGASSPRSITAEHGKVLADALGEVRAGSRSSSSRAASRSCSKGGYSEQVSTGVDCYSIRQPLGVVAGITPFNFPAMVPMWMFPLAIACGNAFVLKPSERDPSAVDAASPSCWAEAGLPDGVFNVVHGDKEAVDALLEHPDVAAVSFVGSTPVARYVYETARDERQARAGARRREEPHDRAARRRPRHRGRRRGERRATAPRASGAWRSRSSSRSARSADELVARIVERIARLRIADGTEPAPTWARSSPSAHRDTVASYVDAGVDEGATLVVDGRELTVAERADGFWLGPCLFDRVDARDVDLPRRDLRPGAVRGAGRVPTMRRSRS